MNTDHVSFQLGEALLHLQLLVSELREGRVQEDDTPALAVDLGHILDHICIAWNARNMSPEAVAALSQDEFERLTDTVPNFMCSRVLGGDAVC